jgi:outer membrane receptor for ferrienterochelin and colicins
MLRRWTIALCLVSLPIVASAQPPQSQSAAQDPAAPANQAPPREKDPVTYAETVVVTASRIEESILDAPAAMTVVGPAQVASSPAAGIGQLLQGVGGLNVIQLNAREFQIAGRQATGILGQGQLVLLDGRPVNNGNSGMFWDQIPIGLEDVERIEVLHGPASMVWGANAMSAVVNIRTKDPRNSQGLRLTTGFGERGVGLGSVRWADARGKFAYKVSAGYYRADGWERPTRLPDGSPIIGYLVYSNPSTSQPKADVRVDYDLGTNRTLTFHAGYGGSSGMSFSSDLPLEFLRGFYSGFADVAYTAPSVDARISWGRAAGKYRSLTDNSVHAISSTFPTAEVNVRRPIGTRQLFVIGASTRLDFWQLEIVPRRTSRHEAGGYVEDQVFLGDKVQLNLGARVAWVQAAGRSMSPRASVVVKPRKGHSARLAVSRGYRVPTPVENFVEFPSAYALDFAPSVLVPLAIVGNDDLRETRSLGLEAGYTAELLTRHTLQATVYRTTARDLIQSVPSAFYSALDAPRGWPFPASIIPPFSLPKTFSFINTGELRNQGVELALNSGWEHGMWSTASYTFQARPVLSDVNPAVRIPVNEPPRHQLAGSFGWNVEQWRGALSVVSASRAFWNDVFPADSRLRGYSGAYALVNTSVAYRLPGTVVELELKATNLLDRKVQQHVFGDVIRRNVVGLMRIDLTK